ncbi:hypothetical protein FQR65_LT12476 [Abscondita terminalis]|nr:hypothetical protein FQR65_LT12476 [Abscondita terminalis]
MIFENLLIFKDILIVKDNTFVVDLVDYYRLLIDVTRNHTDGRIKRIMLLALTDLLGGYLQRFVLPSARDSYYAGYIHYSSMEMLYKLFDELKDYLKTNGKSWSTRSCPPKNTLTVKTLTLRRRSTVDPCSLITMVEKSGSNSMEIPLPCTDSKTKPAAIAVPFKSRMFVGTESKASKFILVKYYVNSILCLRKRNANKSELKEFNSGLVEWLQEYVVPLLCGEIFYPAFGGVLRIIKTAKIKGMNVNTHTENRSNKVKEVAETNVEKFETNQQSTKKRNNLILMALLCTIFLWFLLGSIYICCRFKSVAGGDSCRCKSKNVSYADRSSNVRESLQSQTTLEPKKSRRSTMSKTTSEPRKSRRSTISQVTSESRKSRQSSVSETTSESRKSRPSTVGHAKVEYNKNAFLTNESSNTQGAAPVSHSKDNKSTTPSRNTHTFDGSAVTSSTKETSRASMVKYEYGTSSYSTESDDD